MAFNREDLITWNELAPSLQTILTALQTAATNASNRASKISDKIDNAYTEMDNKIARYIIDDLLPNLSEAAAIKKITNDIEDINEQFRQHIDSSNPHPNAADFLIHHPSTVYAKGDRVYEPTLSARYMLECIQGGRTAALKPNFYQELN